MKCARGSPLRLPIPKLPFAYQDSGSAIRNGPTTSPTMSTRPPVTSAKYSFTLPVGTVPVEKNRSANRDVSTANCLCAKSMGTTSTRT